jgi:hypothetical protein
VHLYFGRACAIPVVQTWNQSGGCFSPQPLFERARATLCVATSSVLPSKLALFERARATL